MGVLRRMKTSNGNATGTLNPTKVRFQSEIRRSKYACPCRRTIRRNFLIPLRDTKVADVFLIPRPECNVQWQIKNRGKKRLLAVFTRYAQIDIDVTYTITGCVFVKILNECLVVINVTLSTDVFFSARRHAFCIDNAHNRIGLDGERNALNGFARRGSIIVTTYRNRLLSTPGVVSIILSKETRSNF